MRKDWYLIRDDDDDDDDDNNTDILSMVSGLPYFIKYKSVPCQGIYEAKYFNWDSPLKKTSSVRKRKVL